MTLELTMRDIRDELIKRGPKLPKFLDDEYMDNLSEKEHDDIEDEEFINKILGFNERATSVLCEILNENRPNDYKPFEKVRDYRSHPAGLLGGMDDDDFFGNTFNIVTTSVKEIIILFPSALEIAQEEYNISYIVNQILEFNRVSASTFSNYFPSGTSVTSTKDGVSMSISGGDDDYVEDYRIIDIFEKAIKGINRIQSYSVGA